MNYLWPLLIVLFSSLLPGERLAPHHIIGALLGLAGTVLLFAGNRGRRLRAGPGAGIGRGVRRGLRVGRLFGDVAPAQIGADRRGRRILRVRPRCSPHSCTAWSKSRSGRNTAQWLAIIALGVGPVGAALYAWDIGMKRGDIRVLGAASYATPLLSTAFLILAGFAKPSANIAIAAVLIAGGGLIAAKDMIREALMAVVPDAKASRNSRIPGSARQPGTSAPARMLRKFEIRAPRCIRPASSRRWSRPSATHAPARSPAARRPPRDRARAYRWPAAVIGDLQVRAAPA